MLSKTKLVTKMEKAMNFCKAYKEDIAQDFEWLSDESIPYTEYLWIVKEAGTELAPLMTALAKGTFDNSRVHGLTDRETKAYLIKGLRVENGSIDGEISLVKDLGEYLRNNEKTPKGVTVRIKVYGEMDEIITIPWHPDFYKIAEKHSEHAPENIKSMHPVEIIY